MDSNALESFDPKAEFRRPSNDAANRKYRKRSPVGGSSPSSGGSPQRGSSSSPVPPRKGVSKFADGTRKKDNGGNLDRDYGRSRHSSRNYHRHDEYGRRDRHVDDYRSRRDSRDNNDLSYSRGKEHRSGEFDKYSRGRSDERHRGRDRDGDRYREDRSGRYEKADYRRSPAYEETRGQKSEASSWRDSSGNRLKEAYRRETKEEDDERYLNEEMRKHDNRAAEEHDRKPAKHSDDAKTFSSKDQDAVAKKAKFFSSDSKSNTTDEQAPVKDSDIDAAKIAAMKAAELVNKNLVGTGYMSTDQKKKLLWGNKKNTASEESAHRWDTAMFGDRERREKFNKLMGVKGDAASTEQKDSPDAEKQREQLQMELEKQYTAGLRRRDGRTVGLGL